MRVIYASCLCSKDKYNELFQKLNNKPGQQVQKYHRLLAKGLASNNIFVEALTALPISRENYKKIFINFNKETNGSINYVYLPIINIPLFKNIIVYFSSFFYVLFTCFNKRDTTILCDVLNVSVSAGALCAAKILRLKNVGIVTDVPSFLYNNSSSLLVRINNMLIRHFDSYLFLTEYMNKLINKHNKPFLIIEGQVDINMENIQNNLSNKYDKKVCIYAGGLQKIYGINNLVEAFIKADIKNAELHLYGNGDYENELKRICEKHSNIKYFGVKTNDYVVNEEIKATLLINPRPTNEEYTKYSFPSKNMEYMVSGTPVLTTKLPGMPEEYYPFVYLIENESVEGLSQVLRSILLKSNEELHKKGMKAKEFVIREKNNVVQAKKLLRMIEGMRI